MSQDPSNLLQFAKCPVTLCIFFSFVVNSIFFSFSFLYLSQKRFAWFMTQDLKKKIQCTQFSACSKTQPLGYLVQDLLQNLQGPQPKTQFKKKKDEQNTHCEWIHILSEIVKKKKKDPHIAKKKKKKKEKSEVVFEKEK